MAALVANAVWRDSAFAMILLMAGLKGISPQLYAAARIDGASAVVPLPPHHPAACCACRS